METTERHSHELNPSPDRFQVLALDGGGVKALFTAHVLARLEDDLGIRIRDHFDLIAGTSAGGILALALGAGVPPSELVDHYRRLAGDVFPTSRRLNPYRFMRPAYRQEPLRRSLASVLGDQQLGNSEKRLVIPSWDVQAGTVHIFKTPHHPRFTRDWKVPMVEVALATSAAPTFFPAAKVDGLRLVDGGVWANNPSVVAIAEAVSVLGVPLEVVHVLNVGTTDSTVRHRQRLDRAGLLPWASKAATLVVTAGSKGATGVADHLLGRDRFTRFDAMVPPGAFRLDHANFDELEGAAAQASRQLSPQFTERFAAHHAGSYTPHHSSSTPSEVTL